MPTVLCGFDAGGGATGQDLLVFRGPTLLVDIGFDPNFQVGGAAHPVLAQAAIEALVDTGATTCCIDSGLAMQLNLPIVDQAIIAGAGGQHNVNMHLAQIFIPGLGFTMHGSFAGVNLAAGGQAHLALMGRTFLRHFTMGYDGRTGTVAISNDVPQAPPQNAMGATP